MLVLSRKIGEAVKIAGGITVRLLGINGGTAKLGFVAPESVQILRDQLAAGTPLDQIEDALDYRDNHENEKRRADHDSSRPSNSTEEQVR